MTLRARSTLAAPRRRQQPEKAQQEQGIALLRGLGATVYRLGVHRRATDYQGTGMSEGLPDVMAFLPHRGSGVRTFVCWEVKAPGGRLRPEQLEFQSRCFEAGVAHVTGDLTALMQWLVGANFLRADQLPAHRQPSVAKEVGR